MTNLELQQHEVCHEFDEGVWEAQQSADWDWEMSSSSLEVCAPSSLEKGTFLASLRDGPRRVKLVVCRFSGCPGLSGCPLVVRFWLSGCPVVVRETWTTKFWIFDNLFGCPDRLSGCPPLVVRETWATKFGVLDRLSGCPVWLSGCPVVVREIWATKIGVLDRGSGSGVFQALFFDDLEF